MKDGLTRRGALGVVGTAGLAALAGTALLPSRAAAGEHPHLHRVLEELRSAKDELENTEHRFGGHKKEAIEAIRVAIEQCKICIENE